LNDEDAFVGMRVGSVLPTEGSAVNFNSRREAARMMRDS
jgi:hypothetical protein